MIRGRRQDHDGYDSHHLQLEPPVLVSLFSLDWQQFPHLLLLFSPFLFLFSLPLFLPLFLPFSLSTYLSIYLSTNLSLSLYLSLCLSFCLSFLSLSFSLFLSLSLCPQFFVSVSGSFDPSVSAPIQSSFALSSPLSSGVSFGVSFPETNCQQRPITLSSLKNAPFTKAMSSKYPTTGTTSGIRSSGDTQQTNTPMIMAQEEVGMPNCPFQEDFSIPLRVCIFPHTFPRLELRGPILLTSSKPFSTVSTAFAELSTRLLAIWKKLIAQQLVQKPLLLFALIALIC